MSKPYGKIWKGHSWNNGQWVGIAAQHNIGQVSSYYNADMAGKRKYDAIYGKRKRLQRDTMRYRGTYRADVVLTTQSINMLQSMRWV